VFLPPTSPASEEHFATLQGQLQLVGVTLDGGCYPRMAVINLIINLNLEDSSSSIDLQAAATGVAF